MTHTDWQAIATTPWWVFAFVGYLLWAGFAARKPRTASTQQLLAMPLLFMGLSVMTMTIMITAITYLHLCLWMGAFSLGIGLGYLSMLASRIKAIKNTNLISVPGTWTFLILIVCLLIAKFYFHLSFHLKSQDLINPRYALQIVFIYGVCSGWFFGKLGYALRCVKSGPYENLPASYDMMSAK